MYYRKITIMQNFHAMSFRIIGVSHEPGFFYRVIFFFGVMVFSLSCKTTPALLMTPNTQLLTRLVDRYTSQLTLEQKIGQRFVT